MPPAASLDPPAASRALRTWEPVVVLTVCLAWLAVAAAHVFFLWLASGLWLLAYLVLGLAWALAVGATVAVTVVLGVRRGWRWSVPLVILGVSAATAVMVVDWGYAFAHGYYRFNRSDFAAVAAAARAGGLDSDEYTGALLPGGLRHLSVNGRAATLRPHGGGGTRAVFLPQYVGAPDGGAGFAYIDGAADRSFDCFGDACQARWSLGDGWYWLE